MSSTPKKRPKSGSKSLNPKPNSCHPSSSRLSTVVEPPKSLFPSKGDFLRLMAVVVIASAIAFGCNFLAGFLSLSPKPFCDNSLESLDYVSEDFCESCPDNGKCYQGKLECNHGYRRKGNLCLEDGEINEATMKLIARIKTHVCEAYAHKLCYGTGAIWVPENDLWNDSDRDELMENFDNQTYLYTKGKITEAVDKLLEKQTNLNGFKELKCPELLVERYKPITCRIRECIFQHVLVIMPAFTLLAGCALFYQKVRRRRYVSQRIEELYHQVCDILEENALASKSTGNECEPWVVASRLRDHLLLPRERKDPLLWRKVEELIQEDSRVDRYPKLVKGESKVVWEWQVEGSLSSSKLKQRREAQKFRPGEDINTHLQQKHNRTLGEPSW